MDKAIYPQQHIQCENQLIFFHSSLPDKVYHFHTILLRIFLSSGEVAPASHCFRNVILQPLK